MSLSLTYPFWGQNSKNAIIDIRFFVNPNLFSQKKCNFAPYSSEYKTYCSIISQSPHEKEQTFNIGATTTQMMTLRKMMSDDKNTISQGYLKLTTVHPEEGIIVYTNIKHLKGVRMTVNIPIEGQVFSFD